MKLDILNEVNLRFISFLFIFIIFFTSSSFASYKKIEPSIDCKNSNKSSFENLDFIEIEVFENRKIVRKIIKSVLTNVIGENNKKFLSRITLHYKNSKKCEFDAKIRMHGDFADHVDIADGYPISSFHVNLLNKNIDNLTSFKLLLPRTRNYFNEIFITNFFRNIGILSPKTRLVKIKFNKKFHYMFFQEHIAKEFLETNNLAESFIFEGHDKNLFQRLGGNSKILRLAKLSNSKIVLKNDDYLNESFSALSKMNQIYLINNLIKYKNNYKDEKLIFNKYYDGPNKEIFKNKNNIFETFMLALGAEHGLSQEDRVFYFDPHYKNFLPIYYDGGASILYPNEKIKPSQSFDISTNTGFRLSEEYFISNKKKLDIYEKLCFENCLELLKKIDKSKLILDLEWSGMKIRENELENILNFISKRLIHLNKTNKINYKKPEEVYYSLFDYKDKTKIGFIEDKKYLITCPASSNNQKYCDKKILEKNYETKKIYRKILSQNLINIDNDNYEEIVFISNDVDSYFSKKFNFKNGFKKIEVENFNIINLNNGEVKVNEEKKLIKLISNKSDQRFIIYGKEINAWKFEYKENYTDYGSSRMSFLTGCVTFLDLTLIEISLVSKKSSCEDAFNFIRNRGSVNTVQIENTLADGIDADFSNLNFKNIYIKNSFNDCLDLSYGKYKVFVANLFECGDKAISLGEKSNLNLEEMKVNKASIALAVKDSSEGNIKNFYAHNVKNCLSAYNKKQEFYGGKININNYQCINYFAELNYDEISSIHVYKKINFNE